MTENGQSPEPSNRQQNAGPLALDSIFVPNPGALPQADLFRAFGPDVIDKHQSQTVRNTTSHDRQLCGGDWVP